MQTFARCLLPALVASVGMMIVAGTAAAQDPADRVNPMVGTLADFGQLSPAAVAPFGMVQLGPDTRPANHAGYDHAADTLVGFSHTRAVGVGCSGAGGDLLVQIAYAGQDQTQRMDKAGEIARAGYYAVAFGPDAIRAEATATPSSGILMFTLPRDGQVRLVLDPVPAYSRRVSSRWLATQASDLQAELIAGTVCDMGTYRIFTASTVTQDGEPVTRPVTFEADGKATLVLDVRAGAVIEVRTGLSVVDGLSAAAVRDKDLGSRPFAEVRAGTTASWNEALSHAVVTGDPEKVALFYTHLFRVMQTPVIIDDAAGHHRGADGEVARSGPGKTRYSSWAVWDNYRTQLPLLALIDPERSTDIARSLAALYQEGKHPWATQTEPFLTVRTEHSGVALLDFRRKGIDGFDPDLALEGMAVEAPSIGRETPDQVVEAAYDDWAVSRLAEDLGRLEQAGTFRGRADAYRTVWAANFETLGDDADIVKARGLYQGTLWQYRWASVFDLGWVMARLGRERFNRELQSFFAQGLFNMTNQPDMHAPFLFAVTGEPWRTQGVVDGILNRPMDHNYTNQGRRPEPWRGRSFDLAPQGYADGMDDDAGAMSAWYVFASLGLYPLVPGEPYYALTTPSFDRAVLDVGAGRRFEIVRKGPGNAAYIEAARLNGVVIDRAWLSHDEITAGGQLEIVVATRPNVDFGSGLSFPPMLR